MKKLTDIDSELTQLRPPIVKEVGVTKSERYLAKLAEKSFLDLWSYPSPYRDQKLGGNNKGDGKELCDLLVVCDKHVIIFSEKHIDWPNGDINTAWLRWVKRAVKAASKQANGAERWINEHPDRIYLDRKCTIKFPIDFPETTERTIHHVIVALGASDRCKDYLTNHKGSLVIDPSLKGQMNWPNKIDETVPFSIGDINPNGSYVHVLDDVSLKIIMEELDTIRDFTDYLQKKETFIRSGHLKKAHGEENLLAYYAIRTNEAGEHDFISDSGTYPIIIDNQHYEKWISDPRYIAKKDADKVSYAWDNLITTFTKHMLGGTSITLDDFEFDLKQSELAVRYMALEMRFRRRNHGEAVLGALERGTQEDAFFRMMIPQKDSADNETAFFIMTLKYQDRMDQKGGYEQYRKKRTERATTYAQGILEKYPYLKRIIGISCEPPNQNRGASEDIVYAEQTNWSSEDREIIKKNCKDLGILQNEMQLNPVHDEEYPEFEQVFISSPSDFFHNHPNRKQRRAEAAKTKKKKQKKRFKI